MPNGPKARLIISCSYTINKIISISLKYSFCIRIINNFWTWYKCKYWTQTKMEVKIFCEIETFLASFLESREFICCHSIHWKKKRPKIWNIPFLLLLTVCSRLISKSHLFFFFVKCQINNRHLEECLFFKSDQIRVSESGHIFRDAALHKSSLEAKIIATMISKNFSSARECKYNLKLSENPSCV